MGSPVADSLGVLVAFSAGLFSFLSPCVLPLFPSYLSFVTGMSVDRLASEVSAFERTQVMLHSLAFIVGFTVVFVSLGASFSAAGQFLLDYRDWIRIGGGVLIALFGLIIAGVLTWGPLGRTVQFQIRSKPAGFLGSFAVGLTFAIGWRWAFQTCSSTCHALQWFESCIPSRISGGMSRPIAIRLMHSIRRPVSG